MVHSVNKGYCLVTTWDELQGSMGHADMEDIWYSSRSKSPTERSSAGAAMRSPGVWRLSGITSSFTWYKSMIWSHHYRSFYPSLSIWKQHHRDLLHFLLDSSYWNLPATPRPALPFQRGSAAVAWEGSRPWTSVRGHLSKWLSLMATVGVMVDGYPSLIVG